MLVKQRMQDEMRNKVNEAMQNVAGGSDGVAGLTLATTQNSSGTNQIGNNQNRP